MNNGPEPPYLVIRGDLLAYWVQAPDDVASATVQALDEGCYRGSVCYDAAGGLWPVTYAAFVQSPSMLDRLRSSRRLPVRLTFGPRRAAALDDVIGVLV